VHLDGNRDGLADHAEARECLADAGEAFGSDGNRRDLRLARQLVEIVFHQQAPALDAPALTEEAVLDGGVADVEG
jgi:hypothetical protein